MRIAYCEDEQAQAELCLALIRRWSEEAGQVCTADRFSSAEQLLFSLDGSATVPYDLLLLDISMAGMDGFSLARRLRSRDGKVRIAFLTADPSHVFEGYELSAWRYLLKPLRYEQIAEMLSALARDLGRESPYVLLEIAGERRRIYTGDILFLEVCGHYSTLHCRHECLTVKLGFAQLLDALNGAENKFVRCHRSAAVNVAQLQRVGREDCLLTGGQALPISRGMYKALNEAFIRENL